MPSLSSPSVPSSLFQTRKVSYVYNPTVTIFPHASQPLRTFPLTLPSLPQVSFFNLFLLSTPSDLVLAPFVLMSSPPLYAFLPHSFSAIQDEVEGKTVAYFQPDSIKNTSAAETFQHPDTLHRLFVYTPARMYSQLIRPVASCSFFTLFTSCVRLFSDTPRMNT